MARRLGGYRKEQDDGWLYSQILNEPYYDYYRLLLNDCSHQQEILNSAAHYDYSLLLLRFNVYLNYIKKANLSFIKKYVFEDTNSFSRTNYYEYTVIEKILVHLYLYYLCFDTDYSFIDKSLRSKISGLLRDNKVISYMYSLFIQAYKYLRCFSLTWENEVKKIIGMYSLSMVSTIPSREYVDNSEGTVANYFLYIRLMVPFMRNELK